MKYFTLNTLTRGLMVLSLIFFLANCGSSKKATSTGDADMVSYKTDIQPIMVRSCAPCHFPDEGKKELLDTYQKTALYAEDIIRRVELPVDHKEFMPFKSKKPHFTQEEVDMIKSWVAQGMPR